MSEENKQKCVEGLANAILNQLTLNGVLQACKVYSINIANNQYAEMSDEDKEKVLENVEKIETGEPQPS